ncbi:MAG TPA: bifunctional phosphopantothenoylcysteine decarboxylase/phosphopantothenate--cysteine ligase CoaBC, partial [Porphyromonadaceae bacterium]|nr:bifunctional phosphopantothenoylcysteine decarboxylase/phosphopantothenate--cysteine ligase CoaBC [Porphyromonadaceae bacterium]
LGLWADAMIVAPATASTIAKMATGVADNMLVTTYLSAKAPVFVAPAMDLDMMRHPSTVRNLELLRSYGNHIIEPAAGELASHLVGKGRMEEPENIVRVINDFFEQSAQLAGKRVLITAGPTVEKIDPVRFISNFSSGKMGFALADECARRGAQVTLVTGPVAINARQPGVERIDVVSADDMCKAVARHMTDAQVVILCAAVADYKVAVMSEKKIKREKDEAPVLQLVKNPDIARMVGEQKRPGQVTVGFALETDNEEVNALGKMERKNLDMIVLNSLRDKGAGFQTDTNRVTIYHRNGDVIAGECKAKTEVAADIVEEIVKMLK